MLFELRKVAAAGALTALALSACSSNVSVIRVDGSSTVFPITEGVVEEFLLVNPRVQITVGTSGTGGGFQKFCHGETDISDASRPIKDEEAAACMANGIEYTDLTIALDGLAVVVNPENTWVECLTTEELASIWSPDSSVDNWKDVRGSFPDEELSLFGPGTDSGTFDYFTDVINDEEGASRADYTASEDDNVLVTGVAGEKGALGYFGYAYYTENTDKLKVLGVDSGDGCVVPSDETVADGTYAPLSRSLFIYIKTVSLSNPAVAAFARFYLEDVDTILGDVGYTPVDAETAQAMTTKLEQALGA